jgi:hypothetical protein
MIYGKKIGRIALQVPHPGDGSPELIIPDGWNDSVPKIHHTLSIEELHDLRFLIDRAIAKVDEWKADKIAMRK